MSGNVLENWDLDRLVSELSNLIPLSYELTDIDMIGTQSPTDYSDKVMTHLNSVYHNFEETLGPEMCRRVEGFLMLRSIDLNWVQHLTSMENLRQGIGLQAVGQRDPLVMYRKEGHEMFQILQQRIQEDVSHTILKTNSDSNVTLRKTKSPTAATRPQISGMASVAGRNSSKKLSSVKVGRNQPCPCGSGKKFKRCCGIAA
jgi:preprotein translocase subunit SecA